MFICDECLEKHYENEPEPGFGKSLGTCEVCIARKECSDIFHGHLRPKSKIDISAVEELRLLMGIKWSVEQVLQTVHRHKDSEEIKKVVVDIFKNIAELSKSFPEERAALVGQEVYDMMEEIKEGFHKSIQDIRMIAETRLDNSFGEE